MMKRGSSNKTKSNSKSNISNKKKPAKKSSKPAHRFSQSVDMREGSADVCRNCSRDLSGNERALFVEEEVGRVFCSEACITGYFSPEIRRLEKEYLRRLSPRDLSTKERETYAHLRWSTLQKPEEVWMEKTVSGDHRFTLISKYAPHHSKNHDKPVWSICICLFLRGQPSFLYLAFSTRNAAMASHYRKGERVEAPSPVQLASYTQPGNQVDSLDLSSSNLNTQNIDYKIRSDDDIPEEEFDEYQECFQETLEVPDEVWSSWAQEGEHKAPSIGEKREYRFIRHYSDEAPAYWYIVVARDTEDDEEIEILQSFPTRDESLVERFRNGKQEIGLQETPAKAGRILH